MGVVNALGDGNEQLDELRGGHALQLEDLREINSFDILEYDEHSVRPVAADIVDGHDCRVAQSGGKAGFTQEGLDLPVRSQ
jgi:hypothetical protein